MEAEPLKILFIGNGEFSRDVATAVQETGGSMEISAFDNAIATLKKGSFLAVLFEPSVVNAASLFQVTSLAVQAPRLPVIVVGSIKDEAFAVEAVAAGAQDFLAKEELSPQKLERKIRCAIERQHERVALIEQKENYYGIFDHLVEGIFRTTPDGHYLLANVALA